MNDSEFEYEEVIVSDGRPIEIDFKRRRRRVVRVVPQDPHMEVSWTPTMVYAKGPQGCEAIVVFKIA